jgi:hypothetical protein
VNRDERSVLEFLNGRRARAGRGLVDGYPEVIL